MDLPVLGCPEHDFTISGKCLSMCLSVCKSACMRQKFCGKYSSRTNAQEFHETL